MNRNAAFLAFTLLAAFACVDSDDGGADEQGDLADAATDESPDETDEATTADETTTADEATTTTDDATTDDATTDDATTDGETDTGPSETCELFTTLEPNMLLAATSPDDAATASMVPDPAALYLVALPEGAPGYVQLEIAEWSTTQAFYTEAAIDYTVSTPANAQTSDGREPIAGCTDLTEEIWFFPHWTPALIEFSAEGPREIRLMIVQLSP